ncbi:hypothetical protein ACGF1Z_26720 [Streptomyces sp. NPDC048018]|uniref:hypothetical protein n=1 Tax=Streptomyces sp. NPDC048018 TaxID=3365499 RepID=UPI003721F589
MPDQSAYDLDLEMSLLLPSSAPPPWSAAVHEAARHLVDHPWEQNGQAAVDLTTLSLLLFARTYTGDRAPKDVPVTELREALAGPADRELRIIDEIAEALTATGQGYNPAVSRGTPLWDLFNTARSQYTGQLGASALADDIEPPTPRPSPMRYTAGRLAQLFADTSVPPVEGAVAPEVESGPLVVESDRIQIVTADSIMPLRCPQNHDVRTVRVDGPEVSTECGQGHVSGHWSLEAARVRMAVSRATGDRPSVQGKRVLTELVTVATDLPRHSDPQQDNAFLRAARHPVVGRDDVFAQIHGVIGKRR